MHGLILCDLLLLYSPLAGPRYPDLEWMKRLTALLKHCKMKKKRNQIGIKKYPSDSLDAFSWVEQTTIAKRIE